MNIAQRTTVVIVSLLVVLGVAACGGSSKDSSASATTAGSTAPGGSTTSGPAVTLAPPNSPELAFCQQVVTVYDSGLRASTTATPATLKAQAESTQQLMVKVLDEAPAAIHSDLSTEFGAITLLYVALDKVGYDFSKVPTSDLGMFSNPEVATAEQHVDTYLQQQCGINLGGDVTGTTEPATTVPATTAPSTTAP